MQKLVERFLSMTTAEKRRENEAQTCQDYILPLFRLLGWDTETNPSDGSTDVLQQVDVGPTRVDYAFRLRNTTRFMLEAKRADANMAESKWAEQAVGYAYNKGLRWAVLTNFETLTVFNALREGQPSQHVVLHLTCDHFVEQLDRLLLLSKESFLESRLDEAALMTGGADPREPVERRLAGVLRQARQGLTGEIAQRNPTMPPGEVDDLIQALLNRLVFIRTAEDRGIEEPRLREAWNTHRGRRAPQGLLESVREIFAYYAHHYDSDLFPTMNDRWESVYVDDSRLGGIVGSLYKPAGLAVEFDFSAIGADALGQVYEQYLAQRVDRRRRGVYYTPRFIVDYIVQHTVEEILYDDPSRLGNIRIADIACGSGSFLIRAYDALLDLSGPISQDQRIDILKRSIFGVDLDEHAINVARLNLLIRALANPIRLPMLADNLVVRNSLVHGSAEELRAFFGDDWPQTHRFDFAETFPEVSAEGGFDVIVGNPPYVEIQTQDRREAEYLRANYEVSGSFDVYLPFIQRALELVRPGGRVGYIVPHKFMTNQYGARLRQLLGESAAVEQIVHFGDQQVFADVTTYTCVLILRKAGGIERTKVIRPLGLNSLGQQDRERLEDTVRAIDGGSAPPGSSIASGAIQHPTGSAPWSLALGSTRSMFDRLQEECVTLADSADRVFQGIITSADHIYHLRRKVVRGDAVVFERFKAGRGEARSDLGPQHAIEAEIMRPLRSGPDVDRYTIRASDTYLLFPYQVNNRVATLIPADEMESRYPGAWAYLKRYEPQLRGREASEEAGRRPFDDDAWYRFGRTQNLGLHDEPKLAVPATVDRLSAAFDSSGAYGLNNVRLGGILVPEARRPTAYWWLVAMLNSRVLDYIFKQQESTFANGYYQANRQFIDPLPIAPMDRDASLTAQIIQLAQEMHRIASEQVAASPLEVGRLAELARQFEDADREMDDLVCRAYGLTADERALVFGA